MDLFQVSVFIFNNNASQEIGKFQFHYHLSVTFVVLPVISVVMSQATSSHMIRHVVTKHILLAKSPKPLHLEVKVELSTLETSVIIPPRTGNLYMQNYCEYRGSALTQEVSCDGSLKLTIWVIISLLTFVLSSKYVKLQFLQPFSCV